MKKFLETTIAPQFDNIPAALKESPRWLCWQLKPAEPKPTKIPMTPDKRGTLRAAAVNKAENWLTFDDAKNFFDSGKCSGLGFALANLNPHFCCVDVDHCFDADGNLSDEARAVLDACENSWAEKSQSGTGIHVWFIDDEAKGGRRKGNVEVYADNRYIAVTGNAVNNSDLKHINGTCAKIVSRFIDKETVKEPPRVVIDLTARQPAENLDEFTKKLVAFLRSDKCRDRDPVAFALFAGDTDSYFSRARKNPDDSVADAALMQKIIFYAAKRLPDNQIKTCAESAFSQSALGKREKWLSRADYRDRTFNAAFKFIKKNDVADDKIALWQKANGKIKPALLKKLKAAAETLADAPPDSDTQKILGCFKFYDFFAALADSYLANLKKNHADDFDFQDFNRGVKSFAKVAKADHAQFVEQSRCDEINAERRRRANDTTLKYVADCPADLLIPVDCYFSERGTSVVDNSGRFPKTIIASTNPVIPTQILRNPQSHETVYQVAVKTPSGWRKILLEGRALFDTRQILALSEVGALIENPSALCKFFARILAANQIPEIKLFSQPGWTDSEFKSFAYPGENTDYIIRRAGFKYPEYFSARGDKELWLKAFNSAQRCSPFVRIFIGTALAAPLVRPLNLPNLQTHLWSKSGVGKSVLTKLTASIFGNPQKLIGTFAASPKNRLAQAAAYNDLPSFFDELETLAAKIGESSLSEMIYNYTEGKGNQAQKRDGTAREPFEFAGARLMTAERPLLRSNDRRGAFKRLLQIHCDEPFFSDDFAEYLYSLAVNNFGHFGRRWIEYITANSEQIREHYEIFRRAIKKPVEPTLLKAVLIAAVAFYHFMICAGLNDSFDDEAGAADAFKTLKKLPATFELDDAVRALEALRDFIASHVKFFAHDVSSYDGTEEFTASAFECYGKIYKTGAVAILPGSLKKILEKELGFISSEAIINEWAQSGFLKSDERRKHLKNTWFLGKTYPMYRFKAGVLILPAEAATKSEAAE